MLFSNKKQKSITEAARQQHLQDINDAVTEQQSYFVFADALVSYTDAETDTTLLNSVITKAINSVALDSPQKAADILAVCLRDSKSGAGDLIFVQSFFSLLNDIEPHNISNLDALDHIGRLALYNKDLSDYLLNNWEGIAATIEDSDKARNFTWNLCKGGATPVSKQRVKPSALSEYFLSYIHASIDRDIHAGKNVEEDADYFFGYASLTWAKKNGPVEQAARDRLHAALMMAQSPTVIARIVESTCRGGQHAPDSDIDAMAAKKWAALTEALDDKAILNAATVVIGDRLNDVIGEGKLLNLAVEAFNDVASKKLQAGSLSGKIRRTLQEIVQHELGNYKMTAKLIRQSDAPAFKNA